MAKPSLFRDPADWARDHGWISRRRALNVRRQLDQIAEGIEGAMHGDEGAMEWARDIRKIGASVAPRTTPAERERTPA